MRFLMALILSTCLSSAAFASVIHDESVDGDLPRNFSTIYTVFTVTAGSNIVLGQAGVYPDQFDSFYLDLNGYRLDSVVLTGFPSPANGWHLGFNVTHNNSGMHAGIDTASLQGSDLIPLLVLTFGPGFSLPMENDIYRFSIGAGLFTGSYGLDFQVVAVPLPSTFLLFLTALPWLFLWRNRFDRSL